MSVGKYLNLKPHMERWAVYPTNVAPVSGNQCGYLAPAKFGGLSYQIIGNPQADVYTIDTESFGRVDIWAPRDNDSTITTAPAYSGTGSGEYLNLHSHMERWAVYPTNVAPVSGNQCGYLAPSQFGGLSYQILENPQADVYTIQTESFGRVNIYAPRDNDSSITSIPSYSGSSIVTGTGQYLNLHPHMERWAVYPINVTPISGNQCGYVAPAQYGGLSYTILNKPQADVYTIQTESFGQVNIWAPRDNDSSITSSPMYVGSLSGEYLNLHPHMERWAVYPTNVAPISGNQCGYVAPSKYGGLSYAILKKPQTDVYTIQTESFGQVNIWAPRDNDSSITTYPLYSGLGSGAIDIGNSVGIGNSSCRIYTRSEWGANPIIISGMSGERTQTIKHIIIHHTAAPQYNSDMEQMRSIQNMHQGWDWGDIGYHYAIGKNGTVMEGRNTKYVGAHTKGARNQDSIGICLFGNFENSLPSKAQLDNLIALISILCKNFNLTENNISAHRDHTPTACPGINLYNMISQIKVSVNKMLNKSTPKDITGFMRDTMLRYTLNPDVLKIIDEMPLILNIPAQIVKLVTFYNMVKNGSVLDLKNNGLPATENGDWIYYIFNGVKFRGDAPGNIVYGYVGKSFGFSDELLLRAAGFAQFMDNPNYTIDEYLKNFLFEPYGDDALDQYNIKVGIQYYKDTN